MGTKVVRDPLYKQVTDKLVELVEREYEVGRQFLTERQVSERFGISRTTANKALANLVTEGVLEFRTGAGTFVRPPKPSVNLRRLVSFTAKALAAGLHPETAVHGFRLTTARLLESLPTDEVTATLGIDEQTRIYEIARLRKLDGTIVIWERRALRADLCPGLEREELAGSIYTLLHDRFGLELAGVSQRIRARSVSDEEARALAVDPGAAALELTGVGHLSSGEPLWYEETLYRGDAYEFVNQVRSAGDEHQSTLEASPAAKTDHLWYRWKGAV